MVYDSPFLYSSVESKRITLGLRIVFLIWGCVRSLLSITPSRTQHSSSVPPGIFSTFAYLLSSRFSLLTLPPLMTTSAAWRAMSEMREPQRKANLVPMQDYRAFIKLSLRVVSTLMAISSRMASASLRALQRKKVFTHLLYPIIATDYDCGVEVLFNERTSCNHHLSCNNNDRCSAISYFFILCLQWNSNNN